MRKKAIGIDLGTTNSVMAVVREDVPEIIPMGTNDDQVLRSAVYFSNISGQNHVSFGKEAIERGTEIGSTENFKFDFKRDIGRPIASDTPDHTRVNSIILSALVYSLHYFKELIETGRISEIRPSNVWYEERTDFSPKALGTPRISHANTGFELLREMPSSREKSSVVASNPSTISLTTLDTQIARISVKNTNFSLTCQTGKEKSSY